MGRPTKLTPEVHARIVDAVRAGNFFQPAALAGGVSYDAFNEWMNKGEAGIAPYRQFRQDILEAEAEAERAILAQWRSAIPENWQAGRDLLARRHHTRWAPKEKSEVTVRGDPEAPLTVLNFIPPTSPGDGGDADA